MRWTRATILPMTLVCGLLVGCGDSTGPDEDEDEPIPAQLYQVEFNQSTNDCGAENLNAFAGLVIPVGGGTSLLGLTTLPIASTVIGDQVTFSKPIPVEEQDAIVTLAGVWTFAGGRHTFTGPTTLAVAFSGGPVECTFSLPTTGSHAPTPETPPDQPSGEPVSNLRSGLDLSASLSRPSWGSPGDVTYLAGSCVFDLGAGTGFVPAPIPYPRARNFRAGAERDVTFFRTWLFWAADAEQAALRKLIVLTSGDLPSDGYITTSPRWYWQWSFDPPASLSFPQDWIDYTLPNGTVFSQTGERFFNLPYRGYYFIVTDVYWWPRDGYEYGMRRDVTHECAF